MVGTKYIIVLWSLPILSHPLSADLFGKHYSNNNVNQLKGHGQDRKEEGFHRRQREGCHFNNSADWGDEAANIISSIVMEHTYANRY